MVHKNSGYLGGKQGSKREKQKSITNEQEKETKRKRNGGHVVPCPISAAPSSEHIVVEFDCQAVG